MRDTDTPEPVSPGGQGVPRRAVVRRLAAVPASAWAVTALWCALLLGASLVWPMTYGVDEPQHIDMAYDYQAHPFHFYGPGQLQLSLANVGMQHALPGYPPHQRLAAAPIPPRGARPSFAQLGGHTLESGGQPNQMVQHPPLYYWMEAVVLSLPGVSGLAWDLQVWLMRLLSVLIVAPVPLLCWATTRRLLAAFGRMSLPAASRLAVLAAALPLTVPNLIRDGAAVNNDNLLILATSVVIWGLARVVTGDTTLRTAGLIGSGLAVGLWAKGFALTLPPIILLAYLLVPARAGVAVRGLLSAIWRPVAVCAAGGLIGSFWWIRNLAEYHSLQPNGFGAAYSEKYIYGPPDHKGTLLHFLPTFLDGFMFRVWGEVGLPDSPSPGPVIIYGWLFVVLVGIVSALVIRSSVGARRRLATIGLIPLAFFAVMFSGSYGAFRKWAHDGVRADQGRYIYGGIAILAALFALGWYQFVRPRFHGRLTALVVAGALVTNAAVWLLLLRSWYQPLGDSGYGSGTSRAFHGLLRWSPVPEGVTVLLVVVLPVIAGALCLTVVVRDALAWRPVHGRSADGGPTALADHRAGAGDHAEGGAEPAGPGGANRDETAHRDEPSPEGVASVGRTGGSGPDPVDT